MARQFGATWWGQAWIEALEHRAGLDPNRLPRGRTYARQDRVARVEVAPGRITALVRGSRVLPYRVEVAVPTLDDAAWDAVVAAIAGRAAHAAALLDGELEPGILTDARAAGVDLLPGPGDLTVRCSCPDWADPCKHAAAVCYLVADALDDDPFVLFTLRGHPRDWVLAAVRRHRREADARSSPAATAMTAAGTATTGPAAPDPAQGEPGGPDEELDSATAAGEVADPGVLARASWSTPRPDPPHRRELPAEPGLPAAWPADPPAGAPFTAAGLTELAADAARRAWQQLADGTPSGLDLSPAADLARRAADLADRHQPTNALAEAAGVTPTQLATRADAWRAAGPEGVAALDESTWRPPQDIVDRGLAAFDDAGIDPDDVRVRSNRFTIGDVQLRATPDGRWWRYERRGTGWALAEPPADTPDDLISG